MSHGEFEYVLGVNSGPHDGSAALLRDGELVVTVEQERLSRSRHAFHESPAAAIAACLTHADIALTDVSEIAVGWNVPRLMADDGQPFVEHEFRDWLLGPGPHEALPPLRFVDHHVAHAASAFHTSGFADAAILVIDGRGERTATTLAVGGADGIEVLQSWGTHESLGHLYGWASEWAGLTMWGTGKLMGLAAYGTPTQPVPLRCTESGYEFDTVTSPDARSSDHFLQLRSRLRAEFRRHNYPFEAASGASDIVAFSPFAASVQARIEEVVVHLAELAVRRTGLRRLVMAGGVALNCSANGKLVRAGVIDELWIPPFPHDAGVSVGAAMAADRSLFRRAAGPRLEHARWAPDVAGVDIAAVPELAECAVQTPEKPGELASAVAKLLAEGALVGWFSGRGEVGQRALGGRSILGDPRKRSALVRLNEVKGREVWRPLAPAILAERSDELFDGPLPEIATFMLVALPVRASAQDRIPAAVHVDGTARPQLVRPEDGPYHEVITAFHERTGVPAVINTSFNLAGEPIVHTPADAVSAFVRSDLDALVVNGQLAVKPSRAVARRRTSKPPRLSFSPWREQSTLQDAR